MFDGYGQVVSKEQFDASRRVRIDEADIGMVSKQGLRLLQLHNLFCDAKQCHDHGPLPLTVVMLLSGSSSGMRR